MSKALFKSTSLVSLMTFISRILGFVRDLIAAQIFGATAAVDAFYIAFKIPNFMRNLFAEGAFSQAFVPVLSDYRQKRTQDQVRHFISHMAGALGFVLLIVTVLGVVGAHGLVHVFAPGLDPYRFELASKMLSITFPYLMLISLTAFIGSILNSYGIFSLPSFNPALLNICLIATAFGVTHYFAVPVEAQAWGVLLAGFVQFFFLLPALYKLGFLTRPRLSWQDEGVRRVLRLMLPAIFGASVGQISILLNTIFASFLAVGSVTWLYYSERLAYFPLGVFGVALATVILPHLSRHHASESKQAFASTLDWGLRCNLLIGVPASLTMLLLSGPLVVSLFQYGKFSLHDVLMTQRSVVTYSIGLQAFMLVKVLSSAFYARQDVRTPVKITVAALLANMILSAVLIWPLAHAGLALASSLSSWFSVTVLWVMLYRRGIYVVQKGWNKFLMQLLFANAVLSAFLWWASGDTLVWMHWHWYQRLLHVFLLGVGAIAIYIGSLWLSKMRLKDLKAVTVE